jgi:glycerol-3-phosphate dehydrogenase (NAD(P)+)
VRFALLGAGSWGTALAVQLARSGHSVRLWARDAAIATEITLRRRNTRYLPEVPLPEAIQAESELATALADAETVIVAIPSQFCASVYRSLAGLAPASAALVSATKGIEADTLRRMTEVADAELPGRRLAVLSGPSFALEVAQGQPTAVVVAARERATAEALQRALASRSFRVYSSDDVVGVELAGAVKNVVAIAAGIVDGLGYGHNTVAALITRGLAELSRLVVALGGRADTVAGLAGLGDLVLTCTGDLSRNRRVGIELGRGRALPEILSQTKMVAEGVRTTGAALALGARHGVELPLAAQMSAVLEGRTTAREAVEVLMLRPQRSETDHA